MKDAHTIRQESKEEKDDEEDVDLAYAVDELLPAPKRTRSVFCPPCLTIVAGDELT